ncbi:hypothetical protein VTN77DRAFT_6497 [Rasamsonia byssochlamydoides]|uniref:uncharacterized protein n=1 Tax=Rasamsonia byssochlamydoides TaxID=89139 RepID=UPI0037423EEF
MRDIEFIDDNASFTSSGNSSASSTYRNQHLRRRHTLRRLSRWVSKRTSPRQVDFNRVPTESVEDDISVSYAAFCNEFTASGGGYYQRAPNTTVSESKGEGDAQRAVEGQQPDVSSSSSNPRINHPGVIKLISPDSNTNTAPEPQQQRSFVSKSPPNFTLPPLSGRLFITNPPRSILDINLDSKHTYAYPSWPRMPPTSHTHSIVEEPSSNSSASQQQQQQSPPPSSQQPSSSSKPLSSGAITRGASFAERMRGRHHRASSHPVSSASSSSPPLPPPPPPAVSRGHPTSPTAAQIFTPAIHHQSQPSNITGSGSGSAVDQQSTPRQLQRRHSLWQPLKSKFSLVRLRGGA